MISSNSGSSGGSNELSKQQAFLAMYPSGRLFVRCGWVADDGTEDQYTPFATTDGPFTAGQAKITALQHTLRMPNSAFAGAGPGDAMVHVSLGASTQPGGAYGFDQAHSRHNHHLDNHHYKQQHSTAAYSNPLAAFAPRYGSTSGVAASGGGAITLSGSSTCSPAGSPDKTGRFAKAAAQVGMFGSPGNSSGSGGRLLGMQDSNMVSNPLAYLGWDVEVGQTVAPPLPPMKVDRALQRVARGVGHKVSNTTCTHNLVIDLPCWVRGDLRPPT